MTIPAWLVYTNCTARDCGPEQPEERKSAAEDEQEQHVRPAAKGCRCCKARSVGSKEKPTAKKLPQEIDVTVFASASPTRPDNRGRQS